MQKLKSPGRAVDWVLAGQATRISTVRARQPVGNDSPRTKAPVNAAALAGSRQERASASQAARIVVLAVRWFPSAGYDYFPSNVAEGPNVRLE